MVYHHLSVQCKLGNFENKLHTQSIQNGLDPSAGITQCNSVDFDPELLVQYLYLFIFSNSIPKQNIKCTYRVQERGR